MAAITITGLVPLGSTSKVEVKKIDAAVSIGQAVYENTASTNRLALCDADVLASSDCHGICVTPEGAQDDFTIVAISGEWEFTGSTLVAGTAYYLGPTAGQIVPLADLTSGDYITRVIEATGTNSGNINIQRISDAAGTPQQVA